MTELKPYQWLDANQLKLIAIVAMTVDHIAWLLFPGYAAGAVPIVMHIIGRITCPVMFFFIAEGFHYTRDRTKYALRLFMLAVVSHFAYMLASNSYVDWHSFIPFYYGDVLNQTSVVWSLLGGLLMLWLCEDEKRSMGVKVAGVLLICLITLPSDWSCIAALCVLSIGSNRGEPKKQIAWSLFYVAIYAVVYFFALDKLYGLLQLCVVLAIPLLALYNGKRGKNPAVNKVMKWLFYIYYPLHLAVIGFIQLQIR